MGHLLSPLNPARIAWNSPAFGAGLLSPAGPRPSFPRGLESASSQGPSPATWGSLGVPYLPGPSGNPSTSCRLGLRARSLPLDSCPQRPRVLMFELRGCQSSLRTAEYFSRGRRGRIEIENGRKEGLGKWVTLATCSCGSYVSRCLPAPCNKRHPGCGLAPPGLGPWFRAASPP